MQPVWISYAVNVLQVWRSADVNPSCQLAAFQWSQTVYSNTETVWPMPQARRVHRRGLSERVGLERAVLRLLN